MKLTPLEMRQIKAIKKHLETVDYGSFSLTAINNLMRIIVRLTEEDDDADRKKYMEAPGRANQYCD